MFDKIEISIPCPNCNSELKTTVKNLKTNPILYCSHCKNDNKNKRRYE